MGPRDRRIRTSSARKTLGADPHTLPPSRARPSTPSLEKGRRVILTLLRPWLSWIERRPPESKRWILQGSKKLVKMLILLCIM